MNKLITCLYIVLITPCFGQKIEIKNVAIMPINKIKVARNQTTGGNSAKPWSNFGPLDSIQIKIIVEELQSNYDSIIVEAIDTSIGYNHMNSIIRSQLQQVISHRNSTAYFTYNFTGFPYRGILHIKIHLYDGRKHLLYDQIHILQ
jgi:hypothetical protein